jgi:poly(3-hydroxybutyrate) depolymerase
MPLLKRLTLHIVLTVLPLAFSFDAIAASPLPSYRISPSRIVVAGISSGGAMAVQIGVAYSRIFKGVAVYAGVPYYCAQDSETTALTTCEQNAPAISLAPLESTTKQYAKDGLIDPLAFLRAQRIYLWSGLLDVTVQQPVMNELQQYYKDLHANVFHYDNNFDAAHGWESPYGPNMCDEEATPYVILCEDSDRSGGSGSNPYDSEQVWMSEFFGKLKPKNSGTLTGAVIPFDQNEFAPNSDAAAIDMDTTGYAFVPQQCASGKKPRGLILALHGCNQYYGAVGSAFIDDAGINQWADTNNIVVLYPQAIMSTANPEGCWNWWGYLSDPNYAQKSGPQMQALYQMVNRASRRKD